MIGWWGERDREVCILGWREREIERVCVIRMEGEREIERCILGWWEEREIERV